MLFRLVTTTVCAIFFLFSQAGLASGQSPLFMIDGRPALHQVDPVTGDQTSLGSVDTSFAVGLSDYQGGLWTIDTTNRLLELDQSNGDVINSITITGTSIFGEGSMAIRQDGTVFVRDSNEFTRISLETGVATVIQSENFSIDGMDFNSAGVLYGVSGVLSEGAIPDLYTLDTITGDRTLIGSTGLDPGIALVTTSGLTFDQNGELFWAIGRKLYTLDTQTGVATFKTNLISGGAPVGTTGLSFVNSVPEPSAVLFCCLGGLGLVLRRRK